MISHLISLYEQLCKKTCPCGEQLLHRRLVEVRGGVVEEGGRDQERRREDADVVLALGVEGVDPLRVQEEEVDPAFLLRFLEGRGGPDEPRAGLDRVAHAKALVRPRAEELVDDELFFRKPSEEKEENSEIK